MTLSMGVCLHPEDPGKPKTSEDVLAKERLC